MRCERHADTKASCSRLSPKCVKIARPTLFGYIATREEFEQYANELFELLTSGALKVSIHGLYSLADVKQAHIVSICIISQYCDCG